MKKPQDVLVLNFKTLINVRAKLDEELPQNYLRTKHEYDYTPWDTYTLLHKIVQNAQSVLGLESIPKKKLAADLVPEDVFVLSTFLSETVAKHLGESETKPEDQKYLDNWLKETEGVVPEDVYFLLKNLEKNLKFFSKLETKDAG